MELLQSADLVSISLYFMYIVGCDNIKVTMATEEDGISLT